MPKDFHNEVLTFSLDMQHRITIRGAELRFVYLRDGVATFHAAENPRYVVHYELAELNRLNRAGEITVVPYALLPEHLRPVPVYSDESEFLAGLPPAQRQRVAHRYAMVRGFEELKAKGAVKGTDESIAANMDAIRAAAEPYFQEEMPDPEYSHQLRLWEEGKGRKPRTPIATRYPGACSPRGLRQWLSLYRKGGKVALVDRRAKQGDVCSSLGVDELRLLGEVVRKEYLTAQRKTIATVVLDVKIRFKAENERREANGLPPLRTPGRDAVRSVIKRLDVFSSYVARHGLEKAMQKLRPVKGGVQVYRPLERVEMDEQKIDVIAALAYSGLLALFDEEELKRLGFLDETKRWWLVVAIDCRTRCILGMVLTCEPRSSAALKCLRMVVSDKGEFANMVGAQAPWSIFGTPETLVTDNGAAFKSLMFTSACTDLGITAVQTITGMPSMRGIGERIFGTVSLNLMPRLSGRTFSSASEREDYEAEKRACLSLDELAQILVRWAVDVYHNTPHDGLGGRTPLQQWEADLRNGNTPLRTAPNARRKHIALGTALARVLQKDGIRVLNVQYYSPELAKHFLKHGRQTLEVRWNEENLGTIEVRFDNGWKTVPAVFDTFQGVHASNWLRACRALKASDPKRKEWEEDVVLAAIRDIEAMNAQAKIAFHILDHDWTEERLQKVEAEALTSFSTVPNSESTHDCADGRGRTIIPVTPPYADDATPTIDPDRHAVPSQAALTSTTEGTGSSDTAAKVPSKTGTTAPADKPGSQAASKGDGTTDGDTDFDFPS